MTTSTVVLTGAACGIGRAAARRFAADGWRCVLLDRNRDALSEVVAGLPAVAGGDHEGRCIDLSDGEQIRSLASIATPISAIVNNAGMSDPSGVPLVEQTPEQQATLLALNLLGPDAMVSALAPRLAPNARVVNVASGAGLRAIPFRGLYSPTKAGLIAQSLAMARSRPELMVTVLCPGFVRTKLVDRLIAAGRLDPIAAVAKTPLGRLAEPVEMAEALVFLASPAAEAIRGQVVSLCGGSSVYGGSRACEPAVEATLPLDAPLAATVIADARGFAREVERQLSRAEGNGAAYPAVIDGTALTVEPGASTTVMASVHEAARRFVARHSKTASLTLLLAVSAEGSRDAAPGSATEGTAGTGAAVASDDWRRAGARAAARMLVSTLACELAPRGLRVNAVEVAAGTEPARVAGLLDYLAGARGQYLTGQTLRVVA